MLLAERESHGCYSFRKGRVESVTLGLMESVGKSWSLHACNRRANYV